MSVPDSSGAALAASDLESQLWEAANVLRGSPVDRTDWKSYILPLLFFKRISDVWDEETADAAALFGDVDPVDFPEVHRFTVPAGCHWRDVRETLEDRLAENGNESVPEEARDRLLDALQEEVDFVPGGRGMPVLITSSAARHPLREIVAQEFPRMGVLSRLELPPEATLQTVGRLRLRA